MDKKIENIVTVANILEFSQSVITKVGFEFQAPLDPDTIAEIISNVINTDLKNNSENKQAEVGK